MTLDEFITADMERTGKHVYTVADVCALTERWIQYKKAAAASFDGWSTGEVEHADTLLFGAPLPQETKA